MALTLLQKLAISPDEREKWYRTLATLLREGHPVFDVLDEMGSEFARIRHPLSPVVSEAMARMRGGGTDVRAEAQDRRTFGKVLLGLVPDNEAMLIDAGESSGRLADGCQRAAEYMQSMKRLRSEVTDPLKEPLFLFALLIGVLVFFSLQVLPAFSQMAPRATWPAYSQWYGRLADLAIPIAIASVATLVVLGGWFSWAAANWTNTMRTTADKGLWPFTLLTQMNSASMLTSLAGFVAAGVPFGQAVDRLSGSANAYMRTIYGQLTMELRSGRSPYDAITALHIVPKGQHWLIRLYGRSTDFSGAMERLAKETIDVAIGRTKTAFGVLNLVLKILVAGFILWSLGSMFGVVDTVRKNSAVRADATPAIPCCAPPEHPAAVSHVFVVRAAAGADGRFSFPATLPSTGVPA